MPGTDADLWLVLADSPVRFLDRTAEYARFFSGLGVGCDVFPYTRAELATLQRDGNAFPKTAWREREVLARRPDAGTPGHA